MLWAWSNGDTEKVRNRRRQVRSQMGAGTSHKWFDFWLAGCVFTILSFCVFSLPLCLCGDLPPLDLQYHLRLQRPTTHIMDVEIDAGKTQELTLDFVMPAWAPG